jgi:hypothetical protein
MEGRARTRHETGKFYSQAPAPHILSVAMPIAMRRDLIGDLEKGRSQFFLRTVIEVVVHQQGAILANKEPRFQIITQCREPEKVPESAHSFSPSSGDA